MAYLLSLPAAMVVAACASGVSGPLPVRGTLVSGYVQSLDGRPVRGAAVQVASGGTGVTDARGRFAIPNVRPDERAAIWVTSDSFVTASAAYPVRSGYETVANFDLIPRTPPRPLDASRGGRVPMGSGGWVEIEPGSLVNTAGQAVQGDVLVSVTYIDPADPRQVRAAPGNYTAVDSLGRMQLLRTFGMADIRAVDGAGRELRLAPGRTAALEWPRVDGGDQGALFRLASGGDWQVTGGVRGPIGNFGTWNFDSWWSYACLEVGVVPKTVGLMVHAHGPGWDTSAATDGNGTAMIPVEPGAQVTLYTTSDRPNKVITVTSGPVGSSISTPISCPTDGGVTHALLSVALLPPTGTGTLSYRAAGLYSLAH
ncbi:MAG TPA: carboxypeptidase-like regulatory domain-containing protein [Longimicrobium sp.]|nr:carboxypeptidase-like regulatory domain-containing protein [Longimicrobium sp.]